MALFSVRQTGNLAQAEAIFNRTFRGAGEAVQNKLVESIRSKMREDTGEGKRSVKVTVTGGFLNRQVKISSDKPQVLVDEYGRRPGAKMPPFGQGSKLESWVKRKFGGDGKKIRGITFAIARKISKRGIKANKPFERTLNEQRSFIVRAYDAAVNQATRLLS